MRDPPTVQALPRQRLESVDATVRRIAAAQHGVATRRQLLDAGIAAHRIEYRVASGRLRQLHRGVYSANVLPTRFEREMAAVLAAGSGAVVSYRTAAVVWDMLPATPDAPIDVTVSRGHPAPGAGIRVHRVSRLAPQEITSVSGVPITTPARTILDLASCVAGGHLERVVARAERDGRVALGELGALLQSHRSRPGYRELRKLIARGSPALTRSEAESAFLELVRSARLPIPQTNVMIRGYEVDFVWRAERLVVEVDGYTYHGGRSAFERDRQRDAVLAADGMRVMRVTWKQLSREREALLVRLAQALVRT